EWSYGFHVTDSEAGEVEGKSVRIIKGAETEEVSPVLLGAGIRTRTLAAKGQKPASNEPDSAPKDGSLMEDEKSAVVPAVRRAIPAHETDTVTRSWNATATVK